jgi:antitoxin MazE
MERTMQVCKWGNSLAIRLPAKLVEQLGLEEGDEIEVRAAEKGALEVKKTPDRLELLKGLRKYRGSLPADFKFDREEANLRIPHERDDAD